MRCKLTIMRLRRRALITGKKADGKEKDVEREIYTLVQEDNCGVEEEEDEARRGDDDGDEEK